MATRRRRGEDGISFEHRGPCRDPERHRHCPGLWRGEVTLAYTDDGKRTRRKVSGKTKAAVLDKLRELHNELDKGIIPKTGYAHYTVRQAAEDWLANGLDGRSVELPAFRPGFLGISWAASAGALHDVIAGTVVIYGSDARGGLAAVPVPGLAASVWLTRRLTLEQPPRCAPSWQGP